jgi:hypothetical protein
VLARSYSRIHVANSFHSLLHLARLWQRTFSFSLSFSLSVSFHPRITAIVRLLRKCQTRKTQRVTRQKVFVSSGMYERAQVITRLVRVRFT